MLGTSVPLFAGPHTGISGARASGGLAEPQLTPLLLVSCAANCAWRPHFSMHISVRMCPNQRGEAVAPPNHIGKKWRRTSDVTRFARAGLRRCPRVVVAGRRDGCASPDRLRTSRYASCHDVCIVSLSGKSQYCASVCNVVIQCLLAIWLILSLVLPFGTSLDRSCIYADRIARFRFQWLRPA